MSGPLYDDARPVGNTRSTRPSPLSHSPLSSLRRKCTRRDEDAGRVHAMPEEQAVERKGREAMPKSSAQSDRTAGAKWFSGVSTPTEGATGNRRSG